MGQMYAWATPKYLLDHMSIEEVFYYYDNGIEFEELKARLLINKLGEAMEDPKKKKEKSPRPDKPDKEAFYKRHGDKIERPGKGGEK